MRRDTEPAPVIYLPSTSFGWNPMFLTIRTGTDPAAQTDDAPPRTIHVVMDDGSVLTECPVILQYIADQKPEAGLAPKPGDKARYKLQEMLSFTARLTSVGSSRMFECQAFARRASS